MTKQKVKPDVLAAYKNDNPEDWISRHFFIPETHLPMTLQPYQQQALKRALRKSDGEHFDYSVIVWSDVKKSAKCLHPDTMVTMANGSLMKAVNVRPGDSVVSYSGEGYKREVVLACEAQPPENLYRFTTSRGRCITVTGEHPILVNGNNIPPSLIRHYKNGKKKPEWILARNINVGDRVVVGLGFAEDTESDTESMYLLGAYVGDGGQFRITTSDDEIRDAFASKFKITPVGRYGYSLKGSAGWLRENGLITGSSAIQSNHQNSYTKRVPRSVFVSGIRGISAFLSGYLDTDGFVCNLERKQPCVGWGSVSRNLLQDCQYLLASLGINATLYRHDSLLNGVKFEAYKLCVYGKEQILLLAELLSPKVEHKRNKLLEWKNKLDSRKEKLCKEASLYSSDKVVSIEILEPQETIAISVANTQNHITNGIITHNSTLAAAVALWRAFQLDWAQIVIVANDQKQADSRVGYYIRRAIELNPEMAKICKIIRYRIELPNHSFIEMVPIDPSGEAGGNADMVVFSELWGAHEEAKERMWTEQTLPPNKFGRAFRWVETYAGYSGESLLLEKLYETVTKHGRRLDKFEAPCYENKPARMFALWNDRGRMPWHTPAYYAQEEAVLMPNEFRRIHQNQWVTSEDVFVPLEWWDACRGEITPPNKNESWVIAMDAGVSNDNFAMVGVTRDPANPGRSIVRYAQRWMPPKGGKIDFQGTDDAPGPGLELRRLCKLHNVLEIAFDPFQLEYFARQMGEELGVWFRPFMQTKERLVADNMLRQMIQERNITHSGEADLREHIGNANAEIDAEERKIRIVKRSELLKIDLAVALSMANAEIMRLNV